MAPSAMNTVMILLLVEIVSTVYYRLIQRHCTDAPVRDMCDLIMRDEAGSGDLSTTNVGVHYSYDIQISDLWHIRPGVAFVYTQRGINFSKLLWGDQISPSGVTPTIEVPSLQRKGAIDATLSSIKFCIFSRNLDYSTLLQEQNLD